MGNEIAKRYSVDQKPTSSGGHGYLWKAHDAVRKKDGAECSVFVFQKSDLERRLKGHGPLAQRVLAVMAKDAAILGELCGMEEQKTKKAEPSSGAAGLFSSAVAMAGVAVGADFSVKTAKARSPRGILQVYEVVESRTVLAFVGERVACSLGNVLHKMWPGVAPDDVPRDWLSIELTAAEVLRGGASACEALEALRAGAGPLRRRWVHLGLGPEAIWLTKSGDWRVAGFGLAQLVEDGRFDAASPFFQGADNEAWTPADGPELNLLTAGPRLTYSAPEITVDSQCQRRVTPAADVFALGAVLYEALGRAASRSFPPLLDGCGDSVYKHRSLVAQRLAENLRLDALPPQATDCVQRALAPMAEIRPDAHAMRGSPAFHTPLVKALRELDVLHLRDSSQVAGFLSNTTNLLEGNGGGADELTERLVVCVVIPALDIALKAKPQLVPHAIPAVLACARRVDAAEFRRRMQPLLQSALQFPPGAEIKPEQRHVLHAIVTAAPLLLEKGDAAWAATVLISAFHMALREDAGPALNDAALLQLGASDCLDALLAKASMARLNPEAEVTQSMLPQACRVAEDPQAQLGTKIRALRAIAAFVERPAATAVEELPRSILPALGRCIRRVDGQPALAMCLLGCYDAVIARLPDRSRHLAADVLPALIPLLIERSLNARQFQMVVQRVETLLAAAVKGRRAELNDDSSGVNEPAGLARHASASDSFDVGGLSPLGKLPLAMGQAYAAPAVAMQPSFAAPLRPLCAAAADTCKAASANQSDPFALAVAPLPRARPSWQSPPSSVQPPTQQMQQQMQQMQPQMQQMQPQVQQTQNRFQTAPRHAPPFEQNGFDAAPQKYAQRPLAVEQQSGFAPQSGFDSGFDAAPQPRAMGFDDAPVNGFGAASADADVSEVSEEASGDVVLLDLDNTLVHMLPRAVMPKCAAISEAVVDVTVADGSTHSIAVRRGAGRFLRALAKRKDAVVQIVTMNKYGVECCAAIAQSDAPDAEAWAAVSVVLVAGRVPGSKSLPFVAKGAKHVLILDDSASAWDDEARPFVRLALKYDVMKQLKTSDDIEEEVGYLDKVRRDALVFLDAAAPAAVAVVEQEVPAAFSQEPQAFAQEPLDEHSMNELLGTPMNEANSNEPVVQEAVQEEEGSSSPDRALTCVRCAFVGPSEGDAAAHVAQCAAAATCDVCEGPHLSKFHEADSSFHDADSSGFSAGEASSGFSAGFGSAAAPSESSESAAAAPAGFDAEAGGEEPVAGEFYEDREGSWSHADDGPNEATSAEAKNAEAHADKKVRNAATRDAAVRERADKEDAKRKTSERKSSSFSPPLRGPDVALKATRKPPVKGLAGDAMAAAAFAKGKLAPPRKPRGAANTEGVKEPVAKGKDYTTKAPFNDKPMFKAPFNTEHRPRGAPPQRELQAVHRPTPREPRPRPPNERPAPRPEKRRSPSPSPPRYAVRADDDAAARAYRGGYDARPPRAQEPRRSQRDGDHFAQLQGAFGNRNSPEFVYHRGGAAAADREPPAQYYAPRDDGYSQRPQYAPQYAQPPMQYMQQAPRGMMPYDGRPSMPYDPRLAQQQPFQQQDYPPQRMRYL